MIVISEPSLNSNTTFVKVKYCKKAHSNKPVKFKYNIC